MCDDIHVLRQWIVLGAWADTPPSTMQRCITRHAFDGDFCLVVYVLCIWVPSWQYPGICWLLGRTLGVC
jgi:hypothetical protein